MPFRRVRMKVLLSELDSDLLLFPPDHFADAQFQSDHQKAPFIAGLLGGFIQTRSTRQRFNLVGNRPTDQFGIIGDRLGSADEIALDFLTGLAHQEIQLGLGFDALGSNWKVEPATETDYGTDDGFRLLIPLQVRDECPVDLDLVEWEGL